MKKFIILMLSLVVLTACSTDDEGPEIKLQPAKAKILKAELPESLEMSKNYTIEVFYELPSPCHIDVALVAAPGETNTEFYLYGATVFDADQVGCDQTSTDLERSGEFNLFVESTESYTFHLWRGFTEDGIDIYDPVTVPVVMD